MFAKLYTVLSLVLDVVFCIFGKTVSNWCDFWIPIVMFFAFFAGLIVVHLLFVASMALFIDIKKPVDKPNKFYKWWVDNTLELLLFLARTKVVVNGIEKLPKGRRFLLVSNHISNLDPIVSIVAFSKYDIIFVSKPENFKLPVVAQFMHKSGFLSIDRENARNAMKTIHKATDFVKNDVASVCIYPEGTRSKTGELLEFKDGVFYVCKKAPCPLAVISVRNTDKIVKNFPFKPTTVTINVLAVFEPESFSERSTHELSEDVRFFIAEDLKN